MPSIPRESAPTTSPHSKTTRMSSDACLRTSRRRGEKEGACGTSTQARPHAHTPLRHAASFNARTPAAPAPPRPAVAREPGVPHNMTRLGPRPAAPQPNPKGGYSPDCAQIARRRRSMPPQPSNLRTRPSRADTSNPTRRLRRPGASSARQPAQHRFLQLPLGYPLSSQPPPLNIIPNPAQKKPSKLEGGEQQHGRQRAAAAPNGAKPKPAALKTA